MNKLLIIVLLVSSTILSAASSRDLQISRKTTDILIHGIKFRNFYKAEAQTKKPLKINTFTRTSSNPDIPVKRIEAFNLNELWLDEQWIATYKNNGIDISIYSIKSVKPSTENAFNVNGEYFITKDIYEDMTKAQKRDENFLKQWFEDLENKEVALFGKFNRSNLPTGVQYDLSEKVIGKYSFVFTSKDKRQYYLSIKSTYEDQRKLMSAIQSFVRYFKIGESKELKAINQNFSSKPKGNKSAQYMETVNRVKKEVSGMQNWWFAETENYILKSNLSSRNRILAKKIQVQVEQMRHSYELFLPANKEIEEVSVITIPATREGYKDYVGADMEWSGGLWSPSRRELILSTMSKEAKSSANKDWILDVLNHEAFHQYLFYALGKVRAPMWFNEGHAEIFAHSKISSGKLYLEENKRGLTKLSSLLKSGKIDFQAHIYANHEIYYADKDLNYPLGWALCYYLRKAAPLYKNRNYVEILPRTIKALREGKSADEATKLGFYGIDMDIFTKDFCTFWFSKSMRSKASRTKILPKKVK
ncbi:DUF1570 domain-containing protein [Lentisphaera profundi]|uniref:DUF1570 domain-containing protein n=1 Tax=Lentisphaera profundi TaxID=1658616 RepID=A0ABY7VTX9_9BACT|nr:DUF1570 domain-containing protein [Lentisphaera profundi]WDE96281.1 DUF1570 domain-containing protein [Lentisphaera profundi]